MDAGGLQAQHVQQQNKLFPLSLSALQPVQVLTPLPRPPGERYAGEMSAAKRKQEACNAEPGLCNPPTCSVTTQHPKMVADALAWLLLLLLPVLCLEQPQLWVPRQGEGVRSSFYPAIAIKRGGCGCLVAAVCRDGVQREGVHLPASTAGG